MAHYIIISEYAQVRRGKSSRTERIYEFLFGEVISLIESGDEWSRIEVPGCNDGGWILSESIAPLTDKEFLEYQSAVRVKVESPGLLVKRKDSYESLLLPSCAVLPMYNFMTKSFVINNKEYEILSPMYWNTNLVDKRERIFQIAMCYLNSPFLRNGRTNSGIDDLNLVTNALSIIYSNIPKSLNDLAKFGFPLSFIEEAQLGDILLFSNFMGEVSHCGLYIGHGRVLHAAGKVRIDRVDHQGIYNPILKRYSFQLAGIITY